MSELILASASPRRIELLKQIGVHFSVAPASICEDVLPGEDAYVYTQRLAIDKAMHCYARLSSDAVVLAADTTVAIDDAILGKPQNKTDAVETLMRLSGRSHQVITAVALVSALGQASIQVVTDVEFVHLSLAQCEAYWHTGEPQDKAGSYAIQGFGAVFVKHLSGSYSNVVGLPLQETSDLLQRYGVRIWQSV